MRENGPVISHQSGSGDEGAEVRPGLGEAGVEGECFDFVGREPVDGASLEVDQQSKLLGHLHHDDRVRPVAEKGFFLALLSGHRGHHHWAYPTPFVIEEVQ